MVVMNLALLVIGVYLAIGLPVGVAFVSRGVTRVDAAAVGSGVGFRALILPGSIALWPVILGKWLRASGAAREAATS